MALTLDGSLGVTFPSGSGTQAAQSKVLQVVNATYSTQVTTTSSSFVTTGLTASITPLFSTSKILVMVNMPSEISVSSQNLKLTVYRNSTNIAPATELASMQSNGGAVFSCLPLTVLDSPATTSSTTYTVYGSVTSGTGYFNATQISGESSTITLMEIAA